MVTKGIIKSIDLTGNTCKVHMPFFETAGNDPIIATAIISNTPGSYNGYKVGDVVLVAFENNSLDTPVVMGKLYLGVEKEKADPRGVLNVEESSTSKKAALPADSVLTSKVDSNVTNTAAPFGSLSSIANELNTLNTNVDQMDRDYGNRFKQVITEIGSQGENFESKLEQTAQSITATVTSTKEELQENIDAVQDNVDQTNKDLADAKDNFSKTITETKTALEVEDGKIKASVEEVSKTVTAHGETIASHTTQISQNTESITLEASARQEAVSTLDKNISDNTALIKENAANIKINADSISQEVTAREEALSGAVKELESKITSTSDGINAQVTERLSEKLDIKNNGESTTEDGQVVQHGFGWDLSKDEWLIKAYDQDSEGTLPADGLDIFKITRDTVEINAPYVRLTGYPRETIVRYAYGTKDTYPALYKDNTQKSIKDEFINTAWSKTELPWSETQYIWQWTQIAKYEYVEENSSWVDTITDNVVRQSGDSAISYWLKCSTPIHIGKNQTENILIIPYKKVGTKAEELDTEAYIRYKWVKDTNAEFISWTKISSSGLTINATDIKASDLLVQVSHDSTGENRVIYDEETITYSPLNTPIIDLTNDKATIQYKPNGEQITAAVSSTATVYLGGTPLSGTTYKWKKKEGTTSITGTNTSTITVSNITSNTAIITCEATTPFKDETGTNVVLSKDFTIFKETVAATYKLKISTPIHTGDLQKAIIKVEALTTLGNNPELPDENAYLRYSLDTGTTWQPWRNQSELEIVTTGCEKDIIVQASHDAGTTIYEQETITYSPLNTPVLDLSNDNATIPYNADDTKINSTENVSSTATVYLNGKVFNSYKIDWTSPDTSCVYTLNEDKHTITITDINNISNSNIATARCIVSEIEGYPNLELVKDLTIIKQVQGVISYSLKTSIDNFVRGTNNVINPANVTFQIIEKVGNKNSSFVIPTTANKLRLEAFKGTTPLSLTADENNTYTIDNTNININTPVIIKLYQESTLIETKTINVIYSGEKGDTGEKGEAGESNYIIEIDNDFATIPTSIVNKQIYRKDGLVDLPKNDSITPKINLPGGVFSPKNIVKTNILNDENASNLSITNVLRFTPTLNTRAIVNKHLPGIPLSIISDTSTENNYKFLRAPLISLPETQLEIKDSTNTVTEYKSYTQDLTTHNVKVYYGTALETITADNFILKLDHDEVTLEDLYTENGNYLVCEIRAYDKDGNLVDDCPSINPTINNNTITNYITAMSGTTSIVSTVSIIYTYYIVRELDDQKIMTNVASSKVELVRHLGPTTYYMNSSATSIKVDKNNNVTPDSISFTAHKLSTSNNSITDFTTGTWKYYWNNDTSNIQTLNNSGSLTINNGNTVYFKDKNTLTVELYTEDQLWDRTTIDIIKDGSDGQDGREITKITTYYIYSAEKPAVADANWKEDLSEITPPQQGSYFCWRKTVTEYTDGTATVDGPTRDETFALAQGKTTNYYSSTDPRTSHTIKEGDCWFSTSSITEYFSGEETENNTITKQYSFKTLPRTNKKIATVKDLYEFYISIGQDEYLQISKDNITYRGGADLFVSYNNMSYHIGQVQPDSAPLEDKNLIDLDIEQIYVQSITPPTLRQWDGSQWQDIGGELVANKVTANFINALDITAKKVTILQNSSDESSPILFEADGTGSTGQVKIGGFDIIGPELVGTNKIDGVDYRVSVSPEQIFLGTSDIIDQLTTYNLIATPNTTDLTKFLLGTVWEAAAEEFYKEIDPPFDGEYADCQINSISLATSSSTQLPYFSLKVTYTNPDTQASTDYVDYYYFYKNTFLTLPENEIGSTYSLWKRFRWLAMKGEPEFKSYEAYFTTNGEFNNSDTSTLYEILNKANKLVYIDPCLITPHTIELSTIKATKFNVSNKGNLIANSGTVGAFKLDDYSLTAFQKSEDISITPITDEEKAKYKEDAANLDTIFTSQKTEVNLSPKGLKLSLSEVEEGAKKEDQTNRLTLKTTPLGSINLDPAIGITAGALQVSNTGSSGTSTIDTEGNTLSKELDYPFKVSLDGNLKATAANIGGWSLQNVELYNRDQGIILNKDGLNLTNGKLIQLANKNFKVITQEKKDNAGTFWDTDNITYIGNNNGGTLIRSMNANGSLFLTSDNVESFTTASATITLTVTGTKEEAKIYATATRGNTTLPYSLPEKRTITVSYSYIIASGLFNLFETTKTGSVTLTINKNSSSSDTKILNLNRDVIKNGTTIKIELTPTLNKTWEASDNITATLKAIDYLKFLVSEDDGNTGAIYSLGHLLPNTYTNNYGSTECNLGSIKRPWTTLYVENIWVEKINGKSYKDWNAQTGTESNSNYNFNNKANSTCVNPGWPDEGTNILDVTNKTEVTTRPITGGTCFDAGTKVTMADGSLKNIEDVKIDDIVLSYNVYTNSFATAKVLDTYKFNTTQDLVLLTFEDGTQIHTTMTHPFYTTSGWVSLKPNYDYNSYEDLSTQLFEMMAVGQYFYQTTSSNELKELKLVRIQYKHGVEKDHFVYNLNIDNTNTFFAEGILGHNVMVKANPGFNVLPMF